MGRFPNYWPFVRGIHQLLVDSPHKGPVMCRYDIVCCYFQQAVKQIIELPVI